MLGAWLLVLLSVGFLGSMLGGHTADDFTIPGTETQRAADLLTKRFPSETGATARVVVSVDHGSLADPAVKAGIADLLAVAAKQPHVATVSPLVTPQMLGLKDNSRIGFSTVQYDSLSPGLGREPAKLLQRAAGPLRQAGVHVEFGGEIQFHGQDIGGASEAIGLIVAVFVLLVAFGSVVAMGLPLIAALFGLGVGLSLVTIGSSFLTIPTVAPTLAAMIGLGVGIDYALIIVTRHREHLRQGMTVEESAGRAIATAGQAVLFAGTTVVIAICGLQLVGIPLVAMMGYATAAVVLLSVIAALTLLPALLGFAGHAIDKLKIPFVKPGGTIDDNGYVIALVRPRLSPPKRYVVASLLLLITLTLPFFTIRLGQTDAGNDPSDPRPGSRTTRCPPASARDSTARSRSPSSSATPILRSRFRCSSVAWPPIAMSPSRCQSRSSTRNGTRDPDGVPHELAARPGHARASASTAISGLPAAVAATGVRSVYVGGETAAFIDISNKISSRLPVFIGAVVGSVVPAADGRVPLDPGAAQGRGA